MAYESAAALRQSLEARLRNESQERQVDLQRLRRGAAFERLLVRLQGAARGRWVLKGGMALELRLGERARATKDLDLVALDESEDHDAIRNALIEALAEDPEGDGFEFRMGRATRLTPDEAGRPGLRFPVEVLLAGRIFAQVRVDVVARAEEVTATEKLTRTSVLAFAGKPPFEVEVVTPVQHFAEKLHALTRDYEGDRPSSRVKDLPDLVLLVEDGLRAGPEVLAAVDRVFEVRATHVVPTDLPDPPRNWEDTYSALAEELDIETKTIGEAMHALREFWSEVLIYREEE